jgi:hypothetical protein
LVECVILNDSLNRALHIRKSLGHD